MVRTARVLVTLGALAGGLTLAVPGSQAAAVSGVSAPVVQQVSSDSLPAYTVNGATMQHHTEVEPDTFAWGPTVVSAFQVGRNGAGYGAQAIGWATSTNSGRTWTSGVLPGLSASSPVDPNPAYPVVVNESVAYDAKHSTWLIPSVGYVPTTTGKFHEKALLVNTSSDGTHWNDAITAVATSVDKAWSVCDDTPTSPYYGNCYVAYSQIDSTPPDFLAVVTTSDGGQTWTAPVLIPGSAAAACATSAASACGYNTNPIVRPNGDLVVVATDRHNGLDGYPLISSVSADGGASFSAPVAIATVNYHSPPGNGGVTCGSSPTTSACLRTKDKPSVDVDAAGTIYVAWSGCPDPGCTNDAILYATSSDGTTWSAPRQVGGGAAADEIIPGFAVAPGTSGAQAQLASVYYQVVAGTCATTCKVVPMVQTSPDDGATWTPPYAIGKAFAISWLPGAYAGGPRMLGDYLSVSYTNGSPVAVASVATAAPSSGPTYFEAEDALTLPAGFGPPTSVTATAGDASAVVRFHSPYPTSSNLTYTATAFDGNGTRITSARAAASPITVPNLTNGAAYTFTVTVADAAGDSAVSQPTAPVTPKWITALSADPDVHINSGSSTTIHTTATDVATGQTVPNWSVKLQGRPASGGTWTTVHGGSTTTGSNGVAAVSVSPTVNFDYRWVHVADASSRGATSPTQHVFVG